VTVGWNPTRYLRYSDERAVPFRHLVAAIGRLDPRTIVDLGCGPGGLTATLLEGKDPVLEWVRGTTLRPVLERLGADEQAVFLGRYGELLRSAYPARNGITRFPFRRTFVTAAMS
jgi:trans-aconitate 2-methyltransferase